MLSICGFCSPCRKSAARCAWAAALKIARLSSRSTSSQCPRAQASRARSAKRIRPRTLSENPCSWPKIKIIYAEEKPADAIEKFLLEEKAIEDRKQALIDGLLRQRAEAIKAF
jgi:hypothetical protein